MIRAFGVPSSGGGVPPWRQITLTTWGPADLQAALVCCEARDLQLYVLVPQTSDLLFSLEHRPDVLTVTPAHASMNRHTTGIYECHRSW
jgi:hypothetical protein